MNDLIQIVLVLYKTTLEDSLTYQSFIQHIKNRNIDYELIIYNNSPENEIPLDDKYKIVNTESNDMLSGAYNYALQRAVDTQKQWLILLDQDTELTGEYFVEIEQFLSMKNNGDYAAVVPILVKEDLHLSPISYSPRLGPYYLFKRIDHTSSDSKDCVVAFNSATMLDVSFMKSIGGFSKSFPLDMLDHWYFYHIFKENKKVFILKSKLEQNLSLIDIDKSMSMERYKGYLESLKLFTKELKFPASYFLKFLFMQFMFSQLIRTNKRKFFKTTFLAFVS